MLLAHLVDTSKRVGATRSRLEKVAHLSAFLHQLVGSPEFLIGVAYLGGDLPQGRIGLGPALFRDLRAGAASEASLTLAEVDRTFAAIKTESGAGSAKRRNQLLGELLARATS
ncbi:MAG TPA: ATP-dependent DNA ligase, partial [Polyangia bacterium]